MSPSRRLLPALVLAAAATACAGKRPPADHFYRVEAGEPAAALPAPLFPGSLRVMALRADPLVRGTRIVYREPSSPSELRRARYHHWVDSPPALLQAEMIRYLRSAGVAGTVLGPGVATRADHVLSGRILRMERVLEGAGSARAVLELELDVTRGRSHELVFQGVYREERSTGRDVAEAAAAMSGALDAILARLLADLRAG